MSSLGGEPVFCIRCRQYGFFPGDGAALVPVCAGRVRLSNHSFSNQHPVFQKKHNMNVLQCFVVLAFVLTLGTRSGQADVGTCKPDGCGDTCISSCQPTNLSCQNTVKIKKVKKHCYNVECSYICIPPVRLPPCPFPFFRSSNNSGRDGTCNECGVEGCQDSPRCHAESGILGSLFSKLTGCRIRQVRKMKKQEYEVEECVWEWSVACTQDSGGGKGCGEQCCAPASGCVPCAP